MNEFKVDIEIDSIELEKVELIKIDSMLKEGTSLDEIANIIIEGVLKDVDILRKDSLDRFIDFVIAKVRTGNYYILTLAFPTKRIADKEIEDKLIELINVYLYPEIVLPILKYFARNVNDSDKNLYLAYLIKSDELVRSIYETFNLLRKDIFISDPNKRSLNVKRIQQLPLNTDDSFSSPLDAACRFKYILEFIALKENVEHIFTPNDIKLSKKTDKL